MSEIAFVNHPDRPPCFAFPVVGLLPVCPSLVRKRRRSRLTANL